MKRTILALVAAMLLMNVGSTALADDEYHVVNGPLVPCEYYGTVWVDGELVTLNAIYVADGFTLADCIPFNESLQTPAALPNTAMGD
jgi:hypothetical protein